MKKTFKHLLFLVYSIFFCSINKSFAQSPSNIGFDLGDLSNWETFINIASFGNPGTAPSTSNCSLPPSINNPIDTINTRFSLGMNQQILTNSRVRVVNDSTKIESYSIGVHYSTTDVYSGLPVVCPFILSNNYSLKLGDDAVSDSAESVKMRFVVPHPMLLTYFYSAVMYSGNHTYCNQPRFEVDVYDLGTVANPYPNRVKDTCSSIVISTPPNSSGLSNGWFVSTRNSSVFCSNWIPFVINLANDTNHVVEIQFKTADCSNGGHFGYCYFDIATTPFSVQHSLFCNGDTAANFYAPIGYANYVWDTVGNSGSPISFGNDTLHISHPQAGTVYKVSLIAPYSGCTVTLYDTLKSNCTTGFSENKFGSNELQIMPNPTNQFVTIKPSQPFNNATIKVLNVLGEIILEKTNQSGNQFSIDLSKQKAGIYFLEVQNNGEVYRTKVVKE